MNISGEFWYNEKCYPFTMSGRVVTIVGRAFQYADDFREVGDEEEIRGITSENREIVFLHCHFIQSSFGCTSYFTVQGYAVSCNNNGESCDFSYEKSSFCSCAIDTFFSPQKAVKIDVDYAHWDGAMDIHVTPFRDTDLSFGFLDAKCQFTIARYVRLGEDITSVGKVNPIFQFEYSKPQDIQKIVTDYLAIYDFLSFANYNTNIAFSDIYISKRGKQGTYGRTATVHIFTNKTQDEQSRIDSITIDDIPKDKFEAVFSRIALLRGKDSRLRYYFPNNKHEAQYIDPGKWLITALNFEGLFSTVFPHFKCQKNPDFNNAKRLILERIDDESDGNCLNGKAVEYYQKCREQVERYEGQLEEKFNHAFGVHREALRNILAYNETNLGVQSSQNFGSIYAAYRNKVAHGSVEPLTNKEVAVYRLLLPLIYFLLLTDTGLNEHELSHIVCKLFN